MEEQEEKKQNKAEENPSATNRKSKHRMPSKQGIRLSICIIASLIALLFFGLSYPGFKPLMMAVIFFAIIAVITLAIVSIFLNWETIYKLSITALYIAAVLLITYFSLYKSGILASLNSVDDIVEYINHSGGWAEGLFVLANFLQVTFIPIPSTVTTTAGAILFEGIWKPLYLTVIGLVIGSMFAFFLGKVFGVRFANWLVGEKAIQKYKKMMKGRDKIVLFYMFIFPFFPDDFLCILAGMTTYSYFGFFLLQVFSRTIGTLTTILITKGIVSIPLYGGWLVLWGFIIIAVIALLILTIKYSEKIEEFILKIIHKLTFGFFDKFKKKKGEQSAFEKESTKNIVINAPEEILPKEQGVENDNCKH